MKDIQKRNQIQYSPFSEQLSQSHPQKLQMGHHNKSIDDNRHFLLMKSNNYLFKILMSEVNESNVAIKLKNNESIIFEVGDDEGRSANYEIDPHVTPIITQNVPFTDKSKSISKWYIGTNIFLNLSYLALIVVLVLTSSELGRAFVIAITVSAYLVYLVVAYHFSNLLPLTNLLSIHEYRPLFEKMTTAACHLIFKYISSRNSIDETPKINEKQYKKVRVVDRSGVLYNISKDFQVIFVKYHKRFYFQDSKFKAQVHEDFRDFIQKCKKETEPPQKKFLLRGKEKIELIVQELVPEMGFYMRQEQWFKFSYFSTLLLGLAVYYEFFMRRRVLRYQIDILKQVCPP